MLKPSHDAMLETELPDWRHDGNASINSSLAQRPNHQHKRQSIHDIIEVVKHVRVRTTAMISLSSIMEKVDEQLLPSVYPYVAAALRCTPTQLGYLTFSRALVQSLASPLGGVLGHRSNRVLVICAGISIWTVCTALFAFSRAVWQGCLLWAVNGIGLALVIPNCQSLTADYWPSHQLGRAFGVLQFTMNIGGMAGAIWGTNIGASQSAAFAGWRIAFLGVAGASAICGVVTWLIARDPRCQERQWKVNDDSVSGESWRDVWQAVKGILFLPTFAIVILQGIVGTFPWVALAWATTYLQLAGLSPWHASLCYALFLGMGGFGSLLGGAVGDWAAVKSPNYGRPAAAQFSVTIGVPLMWITLKALPRDDSTAAVALHALMLSIMGLTITWCAPACNNPMFAEVVPASHRSLIYAFDRSLEGAIAAMGAPLVGVVAQRWGFQGVAEISEDRATNLARAEALGTALLLCTCVPWLLCGLFYSGLYWTYRKDKCESSRAYAARALGTYHRVTTLDTVVEEEGDDEGDALLQAPRM